MHTCIICSFESRINVFEACSPQCIHHTYLLPFHFPLHFILHWLLCWCDLWSARTCLFCKPALLSSFEPRISVFQVCSPQRIHHTSIALPLLAAILHWLLCRCTLWSVPTPVCFANRHCLAVLNPELMSFKHVLPNAFTIYTLPFHFSRPFCLGCCADVLCGLCPHLSVLQTGMLLSSFEPRISVFQACSPQCIHHIYIALPLLAAILYWLLRRCTLWSVPTPVCFANRHCLAVLNPEFLSFKHVLPNAFTIYTLPFHFSRPFCIGCCADVLCGLCPHLSVLQTGMLLSSFEPRISVFQACSPQCIHHIYIALPLLAAILSWLLRRCTLWSVPAPVCFAKRHC